MKKLFTVNLDIEQQPSNPIFYVNTLDSNSVQITINVLESALAKNITGITPVLDILKPDGTTVTQSGTITNATGGVLTVILPSTATTLIGLHQAVLKMTDTDSSIAVTNSFQYVVNKGY